MSKEMSSTQKHEVKAAATIIMEDVICQSFVQSSSTLAYACILIRQKKYDLASHVLHSLEAKQASRFKEMVFYLQAQIGIETGDYALVKRRLVPRVNQHANDMVALALLEACIYQEWLVSQALPPVASPINTEPVLGARSGTGAESPFASQVLQAGPNGNSAIGPEESDFGLYQNLASDQNTHALAMGNLDTGTFKSKCRNSAMEPLIEVLPQILPGAISIACQNLEGGEIHKICLSFQNLTVTSLHRAGERLELVTGPINQSLLTMVRAENLFQKQAASALGRARMASSISGVNSP
jgi:hypothetical protein